MNYNKLRLSFVFLLIMTVIQLFTGLFVLHNAWVIGLSLLAIILCLSGLFYVGKHTKS